MDICIVHKREVTYINSILISLLSVDNVLLDK